MEDMKTFDEVWRHVKSQSAEALCREAFAAYLEKQCVTGVATMSLDALMNAFDRRQYKEFEADSHFFRDAIFDIKEHMDKYVHLESMLKDDLSRRTLLAVLVSRLTINAAPLQQVHQVKPSEYFDPEVFSFGQDEVLVDCGAYRADTAMEFMLASRTYKRLHLFEGSPAVIAVLHKLLADLNDDAIILHEAVVGDCKAVVTFAENNAAGDGAVSGSGTVKVNQVTIDNTVEDKVTFLKMDIEGAEPEAIRGGEKTIARDTPKMTLCVYHLPDHVWRIPEMVYAINPHYTLMLKHFGGSNFYDTIAYFVPDNMPAPSRNNPLPLKNNRLLDYCSVTHGDEMVYQSNRGEYIAFLQQYTTQLLNERQTFIGKVDELSAYVNEFKEQLVNVKRRSGELSQYAKQLETTLNCKIRKQDITICDLIRFNQSVINDVNQSLNNEAIISHVLDTVQELRISRKYRAGRLFGIASGILRHPAKIPGFLAACVARAFGRQGALARYTPTDDLTDVIIADMARLHRPSDPYALREATDLALIHHEIAVAHKEGRKVFCIMAPIFDEVNQKDGYYRRIKVIDDLMGENALRIYMSLENSDWQHNIVLVHQHDAYHYQLSYNVQDARQNELVVNLAKEVDLVYHHSVGYSNPAITRCREIRKVFDLHGALPEELVMYGNYRQAQIDNENERNVVHFGTALVSVTRSMITHIHRKYPGEDPRFIILPILDDMVIASRKALSPRPAVNGKPVVVYAGGMQKWQMIDEMQDAIRQVGDRCEFRVFAPKPQEFWDIWGSSDRPANLLVDSRQPKDLMDEYDKCHYGFLLREDMAVNFVACPTKLIEYMVHGIVPILSTTRVGDFVEDGMQYVSCEDFVAGKLPDEQERLQMAQHNQKLIDKITERYESGRAELQALFHE